MTDSPIVAVWQRIEAWYAAQGAQQLLPPGAPASALRDLRTRLGVPLPSDLRVSLRRHDGVPWGIWPNDGTLLGVTGILATWEDWQNLRQSVSGETPELAEEQPELWHPAWIPVFISGNGDEVLIDQRRGQQGRLILIQHEDEPVRLSDRSFAEYLQHTAESLENGDYEFNGKEVQPKSQE